MRKIGMLLLPAMFGCEPAPEPGSESYDMRIDFASSASDPESHDVHLCVTEQGVAFAVWLDDRDLPGVDDLWLNRSLQGGAPGTWWSAPVKVNDRADGGELSVRDPEIHCSEESVFVVWYDQRDGTLENGQIYFDRSVDAGETFLAQDMRLDDDPDGLAMSVRPQIAGAADNLVVVWSDARNGAYDIYAASSENRGASFLTERRLDSTDEPGAGWSGEIDLAMDPTSGRVFVVWEDTRDGDAGLYLARSTDAGVSWESDDRVPGEAEALAAAFSPEVCAWEQDVVVTWHARPPGEGRRILATTSSDGGTTFRTDALRLDDPESHGDSLYPRCAAARDRTVVAWQDDRNGGFDIFQRRLTGGAMGPETRVDTGSGPGLANSVDIAMAAKDTSVFVGWHDDRDALAEGDGSGRYVDLYGSLSAHGAEFPADEDLEIDTHFLGMSGKDGLSVAMTSDAWFAAWIDDRFGTNDVWFRTVPIEP
jgi:hypothetical protein